MKATSFALVVLAACCLAGCPDEKPTTPTPDQAKAAPAASATPAAAPAKPAEKKEEGGW